MVKGTSTPISLGMSDISVANSSLVLRGSGGGAGNSSSVTRLSTTVPTVKMAVYEGVSYDDLLKIDHIVVRAYWGWGTTEYIKLTRAKPLHGHFAILDRVMCAKTPGT